MPDPESLGLLFRFLNLSVPSSQESGDPEETRVNSKATLTVLGTGMLAVSVIAGKCVAGLSDPPQPVLSHLRLLLRVKTPQSTTTVPPASNIDLGWPF